MLSSLSLFLPASVYVYLPNPYNTFPFISRSRLVGSDGKIALCQIQVLDLRFGDVEDACSMNASLGTNV